MNKPTRYADLSLAFPTHDLQIDVALQGVCPWSTLADAQAIFAPCDVELLGLSYRKNGIIALRLRCNCHDELDRIDADLRASATLRVVEWSITIGRPRN